jgi:integral membrane protein (TIGR01906 family)
LIRTNRYILEKIILALTIFLIASTSVMIYLSNLKSVAFDHDFYTSEFVKYDIYSRFDKSTDIDEEAAFLIGYLESGKGVIQSDFYNAKEKAHLIEVRELFSLASRILDIAVIISIISLFLLMVSVRYFSAHLHHVELMEYFKKIVYRILIGVGVVVDAIALLFAAMAFSFSTVFYRFHELFFRSSTWLLDPATDNLIRMFPEPFFFDTFLRIVMLSVVFATVLLVAGFLIKLGKPDLSNRKR